MCQIQAGYFTKNGTILQTPVCSATSLDKINVESVVTFSSDEIGKQYKCELKISGPGLPSFSFFTSLRAVKSTETFTSEDFVNPIPVGKYTCVYVAIYDSIGNTICTFVPMAGSNGSPCNTVNITSSTIIGSIKFESNPAGAEIFIDGTDQKQITPYTIAGIPVGNHSYKLTLPNHPDITGSVIVKENTISQVSADFTTGQVNVVAWVVGIGVVAVVIGGIIYAMSRPRTSQGIK